MSITALEAFTGMILRPMQGPLTYEQTVRLSALRHAPYEGKALAATYEADLRAGRIPRI